MLIVQKFGGSSLADMERLRAAAEIIGRTRREGNDVAAVVSAAGDTTDELLELAYQIDPAPTERELAALLSTGEQRSAALMALMLRHIGIEAASFTGAQAGILTTGDYGDAKICLIAPGRLQSALRDGCVAVVCGFQGRDLRGDITTLGRGGSDTTAVALAAALKADRCEIYTDVDGIYTADPRLVTGAKQLSEIDFGDMLRLARAGSQVLHSRSVELAMKRGVEILLLSSFTGSGGSTVKRIPEGERAELIGVTRNTESSELCAVGRGADAQLAERLTRRLRTGGIEVLGTRVEERCVFLRVPPEKLRPALEIVHSAIF